MRRPGVTAEEAVRGLRLDAALLDFSGFVDGWARCLVRFAPTTGIVEGVRTCVEEYRETSPVEAELLTIEHGSLEDLACSAMGLEPLPVDPPQGPPPS